MHESRSLCEDEDLSISKQDKEFLKKMNEVIEENIADPSLGVDKLEAAASMSSSTLLRKFKKLLNTTPNNYIRTKRLILAARMMEEGNDRASDVCWSCGFNSTSYFTKCFKEYYGKEGPPSPAHHKSCQPCILHRLQTGECRRGCR